MHVDHHIFTIEGQPSNDWNPNGSIDKHVKSVTDRLQPKTGSTLLKKIVGRMGLTWHYSVYVIYIKKKIGKIVPTTAR